MIEVIKDDIKIKKRFIVKRFEWMNGVCVCVCVSESLWE
jgi:hypothetical protein